MHKLINATIEIIKAMASISYNDVGNKRIFRRPTGVYQVEANPSSSSLKKKMYVLTKQMEILRRP